MVVGIIEVSIAVVAFSLKEKRGVVKRVLHRTRNQFHIAGAEVDFQDNMDGAVLGFSAVGTDHQIMDRMLTKIEDFIVDLHLAEVMDVQREIHHF
ncbi:MAG: DUF503 domain-containing protein [Deltaproteobacteria bacterium]|nr:DUF503 domain-containing protein [Deltaproteobacteria bacterium]